MDSAIQDYIEKDTRQTLYYNKYQYRATFVARYSLSRYSSPLSPFFDDQYYANINDKFWKNRTTESMKEVSDRMTTIKEIYKFIDESRPDIDIKYRAENRKLSVYFSDIEIGKKLLELANQYHLFFKIAEVMDPIPSKEESGIIFLKNPKNKYRLYLQSVRCEAEDMDRLRKFLIEHKEHFNPCRTLLYTLSIGNRRRSPMFFSMGWIWIPKDSFIDYDDENWIFTLGLHHPEIIGKKYNLEKSPE